jgi:hypothetical protein
MAIDSTANIAAEAAISSNICSDSNIISSSSSSSIRQRP